MKILNTYEKEFISRLEKAESIDGVWRERLENFKNKIVSGEITLNEPLSPTNWIIREIQTEYKNKWK